MNYRRLGKTGLRVAEISLRLCGACTTISGPTQAHNVLAVIQRAWELGVNFFAVASVHKHHPCQAIFGRFLRTLPVPRDQIYVASEVIMWPQRWPDPLTDPQWIIEDCDGTLRRLGTDYIDVYHGHIGSGEHTDVVAEAFRRLKGQGKVRFVGLTTNDFASLQHVDRMLYGVDTLAVEYSLLHRQPEQDMFPYCQQQDIGVIACSPLAMGKLTGTYTPETVFPEEDRRGEWLEGKHRQQFLQDLRLVERLRGLTGDRPLSQTALACVLAHPAVATTVPSATTPHQVEINVPAVEYSLSSTELMRIKQLFSPFTL